MFYLLKRDCMYLVRSIVAVRVVLSKIVVKFPWLAVDEAGKREAFLLCRVAGKTISRPSHFWNHFL